MPLRCIFAVLFVPFFFCGCAPKADDEPTWVGLVAAFGGPDAAGGRLKQGAAMAVDDAASLRVEGRRLAVVTADDRGSEDAAGAEAVRLLAVNRVAALVGGADPGRALRLARAAQPYGAPVVLPGELAGPLPGDAVFTLGVRPAWRGQVLARYASDALKAKRAFVLTDERDPVAVEVAAGFVEAWPTGEGSSVEQASGSSDADLQDRAARAAAGKPDVVLIAAAVPTFLRMQAGFEEGAGTHPTLLYGGEDAGARPLRSGSAEACTATVVAPEGFTDRGKEFAEKYQERFHEAPDWAAVEGYDAARLVFDAMTRAKTIAAERVQTQLAATADFETLTGSLRFKDGRARRRVFVVAVHGGDAKAVQTIDPEPDAPAGR